MNDEKASRRRFAQCHIALRIAGLDVDELGVAESLWLARILSKSNALAESAKEDKLIGDGDANRSPKPSVESTKSGS